MKLKFPSLLTLYEITLKHAYSSVTYEWDVSRVTAYWLKKQYGNTSADMFERSKPCVVSDIMSSKDSVESRSRSQMQLNSEYQVADHRPGSLLWAGHNFSWLSSSVIGRRSLPKCGNRPITSLFRIIKLNDSGSVRHKPIRAILFRRTSCTAAVEKARNMEYLRNIRRWAL